ncbi:hypothetical protein, partial [Thiolapillus sp.]|uniref:hypothetical protein n=1 Tax=Thiolapillus sp. TaxID=2017437 RepID=UPI003AF98B0D
IYTVRPGDNLWNLTEQYLRDISQACRYLVIDFGTSKSPYMVSSRFARLNNPNDRDKIASIYPACLRRM